MDSPIGIAVLQTEQEHNDMLRIDEKEISLKVDLLKFYLRNRETMHVEILNIAPCVNWNT